MDDDLYLSTQVDQNRIICISSISRKTFEECASGNFDNDRGYFIYEADLRPNSGGISILAKLASLDAAYHFYELLGGLMPRSAASSQPKYG